VISTSDYHKLRHLSISTALDISVAFVATIEMSLHSQI